MQFLSAQHQQTHKLYVLYCLLLLVWRSLLAFGLLLRRVHRATVNYWHGNYKRSRIRLPPIHFPPHHMWIRGILLSHWWLLHLLTLMWGNVYYHFLHHCRGFFAFLWSLCDCPFSVYENLHSSTKSFITLFISCKTLIKAHADRSLILELLEKRFGHVYISTYGIKLGDETAFHDYISWPVFRFYYMLDIHFLQVYKNKQKKQTNKNKTVQWLIARHTGYGCITYKQNLKHSKCHKSWHSDRQSENNGSVWMRFLPHLLLNL